MNGEILSAPAIGPRAVVVRTVDGKLRGLALADGNELWLQEQQVPRLSLRGVARPTIAGDLAICGFDNGKVVAVNPTTAPLPGRRRGASNGRTELERLVDIDSARRVSDQDVFVVGFQGKVAMLVARHRSGLVGARCLELSRPRLDDDNLYITSADGEVSGAHSAHGRRSGDQKALLHRGLSAPALSDDAVVVADYQGYVHWLDKATGDIAARVSTEQGSASATRRWSPAISSSSSTIAAT